MNKPVKCRKCRRVLKDPLRAALRIGRVCEAKERAERGETKQKPARAGPGARLQLRLRALRSARDAGQEPLFELDQELEQEMDTTSTPQRGTEDNARGGASAGGAA